MNTLTDLHLHTTASDGSDTPAQLLEKLKNCGVGTFAVTDHDTISGALEMDALAPPGVRFIRGVEFSCTGETGNCHILGYGFDPDDALLRRALADGSRLRQEKLERRLGWLRDTFGIELSGRELDWLRSLENPGKPHLGQVLADRGDAPDMDTAIRKYINGCRGGRDRIPAKQAIEAIRSAGGIPVWAHPLGGEGERRLTHEEFEVRLAELLGWGIRGLECYYSRYDPEDIAFLKNRARAHRLLVSGGSDYHGSNKRGIDPGMLNRAAVPVPAECLTILEVLDP